MRHPDQQKLNPWLSIWLQPRATMQQIITTDAKHLVLVLVTLAAFNGVLGFCQAAAFEMEINATLLMIIAGAAMISPIVGIFFLYLFSALLQWTGKWLGGQAPIEHIRAAWAWSCVPAIWAMILWLPKIILSGQETFSHLRTPQVFDAVFQTIGFVISIWAFIVLLKCLGQAQGFSAWRALGSVVLVYSIAAVPIIVLLVVFS